MNSPIEKIMIYIDGTEQSITAARYAVCLAKQSGAELHGLYVVNTRALDELLRAKIFLKDEESEYEHDLEADAKRYLNHVTRLASDKGIALKGESRTGNVHNEIVDAVRGQGIDLLVIGELSRIRSRRDEFYNESERAMRAVPCSVLIVKDEDRVWEQYEALD